MPPPLDPRADRELVNALNGGEASAFDAIYWRYRDWVVRLAYRFTRSQDDSLDVLQETFVYLSRKFPGFNLTASMTTFLYPVVKNISLAIIRKRRPAVQIDEALLTAPASLNPAQDDRALLSQVLGRISEPAREVLLMRFVDGMKLQEIAQALEIPLGTVKSRIHNALETLRSDQFTRKYFEK